MSTITPEQEQAIRDFLAERHIPSGLGHREEACSIAAINLALSGTLTDDIPDCMSPVIGRWIIHIQDAMPDDMRNSREWREMLPLAAGTGRSHEPQRLAMILDWMWGTVLPQLQDLANARGYGREWQAMTEQRTALAADTARYAAAEDAAADWAAWTAATAARTAWAAVAAGATAAATAAAAAEVAAAVAAAAAAWETVDPAELLTRLVAVE